MCASALGRAEMVDVVVVHVRSVGVWAVIPHFVLTVLVLFVADQVTVQRYLAARSLVQAKWSVTWSLPGRDRHGPGAVVRRAGVVGFLPRQPAGRCGRFGWPTWTTRHISRCATRADSVDCLESRRRSRRRTSTRLVADRRLLRPNTHEPFVDVGLA